jgi:hypothetical protein
MTHTLIGMFRTGLPQDAQHGLLMYTAEVFEVQPDRLLVNYPIGLNYRRPEWVAKDKLIDWIEGHAPPKE